MKDGIDPGIAGKDVLGWKDVALASLLGIAGLLAVRWLVQHPEETRRLDMAVLLGTQKAFLAVSDGCRWVADRAGTEYNKVRV